MALTKTTKTSSIIKTRSQSCTGTNVAVATGRTTGTNERTIDSVDPDVTTNDPVPVTDDLFAGRPNTGALKDPPPVVAVPVLTGTKQAPRDRDMDSDSDDAKKPAVTPTAKPKGRPKTVTSTARKPRKSRAAVVDANELVDPMSCVHVTAGGIARAGGSDPVLANPEHLEPEQFEPQPKKKTQRTTRASRAHRAGRDDDDDDADSYRPVGTGTGGYGNGGNGGGDDDDYDDSDPDADSIADSQGVPEAPGVYTPIIIGDTPEERSFSMYLSGPPFNCTNTARRVLHFQHFKTWHDVRIKSHDDIVKSFAAMSKYDTAVPVGNNKYRYIRALGLNLAHLTLLQGLRAFAHHHWLIQQEPQYGDATEHGLIAALQDYLSIKARMARAKDNVLPERLTQQNRFKKHLDQLDSYLESTVGTFGAPLAYITRVEVAAPSAIEDPGPGLPTPDQELIRRTRHERSGPAFRDDLARVWKVIKDMTLGGPFYAHVQPYNASQDGRKAYNALRIQLYGEAAVELICMNANTKLGKLDFQNKRNYPFNTFLSDIRNCFTQLEIHNRPLAEPMKIGYLRNAIIREPRHGARWEVDLLQPPYINDFEAAAQLVATAYATGGQTATIMNTQNNNTRNVAAANQAPTNNNNNNRKRRHTQSNNNNRSSRTSSSQQPKKHSFDSANPAQYYANSAWKNFTDAQKQAVKDAWAAKKQARRNTRNNSATNQSTVPGDTTPDTNNTTSAGSQMGGRASS